MISFLLYHFAELDGCLVPAPDNTGLLNNWLMGGTWLYLGLQPVLRLLQMVQDREIRVDQDLFLTDLGSWGLQVSYLISSITISLLGVYTCCYGTLF